MANLKYSPELRNEFCGYIEAGATNRDAATMCGISESVLYMWLSDDEANPLSVEERLEFLESMGRARAKRNTALANRIINASTDEYLKDTNGDFVLDIHGKKILVGRGDWRSAAWYLERTLPEEYVVKEKFEHSGAIDSKLTVNAPKELIDAYNRAIEEIATQRNRSKRSAKSKLTDVDAGKLQDA